MIEVFQVLRDWEVIKETRVSLGPPALLDLPAHLACLAPLVPKVPKAPVV